MIARLQVEAVSWQVERASIVERISFVAQPGEFIAMVGRNGAGKSTLLDLIAALKTPSSGGIAVDGRVLAKLSAAARARLIAHLPQLTRDALPFTVEQLVSMGRYPHSDRWFESAADREAVERTLDRCRCASLRHRRLTTLSGGERQRALLAACLAQDAGLLLLDEPSTFLDVEQQLDVFSMLREEAAAGRTCIAVTHDLNLALSFATRLMVMANRTVAADLPIAEARARPDWLALFSSRLTMTSGIDGQAWVAYQ